MGLIGKKVQYNSQVHSVNGLDYFQDVFEGTVLEIGFSEKEVFALIETKDGNLVSKNLRYLTVIS
jgi:hypothetical protein